MTSDDDYAAFQVQVRPFTDALRSLVEEERAVRQRRGLLPATDSSAMREIANGQPLVGRAPWGDNAVQAALRLAAR